MAKNIKWSIALEDGEHTVYLKYSMMMGKAIVTIDGDEFDISTGFGKLKGTNQMFRLGDTAALLDFPNKGVPEVYIDNVGVNSGKRYGEK